MVKHALLGLLMVLMVLSIPAQEKTALRGDVEVVPLSPGIWQHVTYKRFEKNRRIPANGLIVASGSHAVMIDTPWTPEQTALLLDWVEKSLKAKVEAAIVGHSHWI